MNYGLGSVGGFLPTIIKNLGYSEARAQLFTVPPYAVSLVFMYVLSFFARWRPYDRLSKASPNPTDRFDVQAPPLLLLGSSPVSWYPFYGRLPRRSHRLDHPLHC